MAAYDAVIRLATLNWLLLVSCGNDLETDETCPGVASARQIRSRHSFESSGATAGALVNTLNAAYVRPAVPLRRRSRRLRPSTTPPINNTTRPARATSRGPESHAMQSAPSADCVDPPKLDIPHTARTGIGRIAGPDVASVVAIPVGADAYVANCSEGDLRSLFATTATSEYTPKRPTTTTRATAKCHDRVGAAPPDITPRRLAELRTAESCFHACEGEPHPSVCAPEAVRSPTAYRRGPQNSNHPIGH